MEITTDKVDCLLSEMKIKLISLQSNATPDTDWDNWNVLCRDLRENVFGQLVACEGKFNGDVHSVGALSSNADIQASIHYAKERLG